MYTVIDNMKFKLKENEKDLGKCPQCGKVWQILDVPQIGLHRTVETTFGGEFPCDLCEAFMGVENSDAKLEGILG